MATAINSIDLIKGSAETAAYFARQAAVLRKHQKSLTITTKFVDAVLGRHPELTANAWADINQWGDTPVALRLSVAHSVTSMKEGIAPDFMRSLLEAGFDIDKTSDTANAVCSHRTFEFTRSARPDIQMLPIALCFTARLIDAPDATCRKVQTGTRVVELPTYQLVCDE